MPAWLKLYARVALCFALSLFATLNLPAQTSPPGQVSRKTSVSSTTSNLAFNALAAPASTSCVVVPGATPPGSIEVATISSTAAAAASEADNMATVAKTYVNQAVAAATTAHDKLDVENAAAQADLVAAYSELADDCSKQAEAAQTAANGATIIAAGKAAVAARDDAKIAFQNVQHYLQNTSDRCTISGIDSSGNPTYNYKVLFPLQGNGCDNVAKLYYFQVGKTTTFAGQAQYLYNAEQSTSQINADLMTATFSPGFQAVLAGTATQGSSQPASVTSSSSGTSASGSSQTTDSVSTTVSKLEQGGDFNLRFPFPLVYGTKGNSALAMTFTPNVGITINGVSGQNTITESTNYSLNVPIEAYGQLLSIPTPTQDPAIIYGDVRYGLEWISSDLAQKIGTAEVFGIGSISTGLEFVKSIRVGMQYFFGPAQAYCVPSTNGGCTPATGNVSGFHFVVSFTVPSKPS